MKIEDKTLNKMYRYLVQMLESELNDLLIEINTPVSPDVNMHAETVNTMKLIYKQKFERLQMLIRKHREKVEELSNDSSATFDIKLLKQYRLSLGLTLRRAEELTGLSNAYLSLVENGKIKNPSFKAVNKLKDLYNFK